jgi:hypothetical protein
LQVGLVEFTALLPIGQWAEHESLDRSRIGITTASQHGDSVENSEYSTV